MRINISKLHPEMDEWQMGTLAMERDKLWTDCQGQVVELTISINKPKVLGRVHPEGQSLSSLRYEEETGKLMFTSFKFYDTDANASEKPTVGHYDLKFNKSQPMWKLGRHSHNLWQRGGTLRHGGLNYAGFGGYYSIFEGGSYGPALVTWNKALLGYPEGHRVVRPAGCTLPPSQPGTGDWLGTNPLKWTGADRIGGDFRSGGCVLFNNKLYFFCQLGMGKIEYRDGGVQASLGWASYVYEYNFRDVLASKNPWEPVPNIYQIGKDVKGACVWRNRIMVYNYPNVEELDV